MVPARAILIQQQNGVPPGAGTRASPRSLDLHQRDEAVHLGLVLHEFGQYTAKSERFVAQRRTHPVAARGGRITLVEDQVDDPEH